MFTHLVFLIYLIIVVLANFKSDLIVDYFGYKKVPSVIGFSCNVMEGKHLLLVRIFMTIEFSMC